MSFSLHLHNRLLQPIFQYCLHLSGIGVDGQYLAVAPYEEAATSGIANAVSLPDAEAVVKLQKVEPRITVAPYRRLHCVCVVILTGHANNGKSAVFILVIKGNKLFRVLAARRAPTAPEVNQGHTASYLFRQCVVVARQIGGREVEIVASHLGVAPREPTLKPPRGVSRRIALGINLRHGLANQSCIGKLGVK